MCLILFAVAPSDRYRLVVAANRDELYARPTSRAAFWDDHPGVLAGRDQDAGGTWLGVNRAGHFAAVTNFREAPADPLPPRSRGELPLDFLATTVSPEAYLQDISSHGEEYKGFNLITADRETCYYYGNRAGVPRQLPEGTYGLSNQLLDCDWPKVIEGKTRLNAALGGSKDTDELVEQLFRILLDDGDEREFSNSFITSDLYGTRAATVVIMDREGQVTFEERNFQAGGAPEQVGRFDFRSNVDS